MVHCAPDAAVAAGATHVPGSTSGWFFGPNGIRRHCMSRRRDCIDGEMVCCDERGLARVRHSNIACVRRRYSGSGDNCGNVCFTRPTNNEIALRVDIATLKCSAWKAMAVGEDDPNRHEPRVLPRRRPDAARCGPVRGPAPTPYSHTPPHAAARRHAASPMTLVDALRTTRRDSIVLPVRVFPVGSRGSPRPGAARRRPPRRVRTGLSLTAGQIPDASRG